MTKVLGSLFSVIKVETYFEKTHNFIKKMLESRPEDALVKLEKTVEIVETAETARTAHPACTAHPARTAHPACTARTDHFNRVRFL